MPADPSPRLRGTLHALVAFEVGAEIDLERAARLVREDALRPGLGEHVRVPRAFGFVPRPLEIALPAQTWSPLPGLASEPRARVTLFDFGAASVELRIPFDHSIDDLIALSVAVSDAPALISLARRALDGVLDLVSAAVAQPRIEDDVEQMAIFAVPASPVPVAQWLADPALRARLAALLRCEPDALAEEQIEAALRRRAQYRPDELLILDWDAAVVLGAASDDERAVLEFANVELLELRLLDRRLDRDLEEAYDRLQGSRLFVRPASALDRVSRLEVDGVMSYERVANALVLFGDQYLATVHGLARDGYGLGVLASGILRKLERLRAIYQMLAERAAERRALFVEWMIVALILVEIVLGLAR